MWIQHFDDDTFTLWENPDTPFANRVTAQQALQAIHDHYGHISPDAIKAILGYPVARLGEVIYGKC